jgi:type IV pilus assembly protein PilZ
MSFIENGGLFVETKGEYRLGDEVFMLVTLPEDKERYPVAGAVVWVTPEGAVGSRKQGIGVQINDQDKGRLRNKIEGLLEGLMESDRPTMTM